MKRAAIYARVSTDIQRDNYSIPSQVAESLNYAQENDYTLVGDQFVDPETGYAVMSKNGSTPAYVDDYSSRELSRPGLDAAIDYLDRKGFDVLVVFTLDRLARDPYIRESLEREIGSFGAKVEYVLGSYDESPEGEIRKDLDATFAKWENAKRVERCNRGKKRKAEMGLFVAGRIPYGYRADKKSLGGLTVDDSQATVVRYVFDLYVHKGESIRGITKLLRDEKALNASGNTKWGKSTIGRMLCNTAYIGKIHYNKHKRNGKQLELRDRNEWIEIETLPIVDDLIFHEAQRKLRENKKFVRRMPKRFYLLSGMVLCEDCHRPYSGHTERAGRGRRVNDAQYYRHREKEGHCVNRFIPAKKIEPVVWEEIVNMLLDPESLRRGYESSLEQQESTRSRHRDYVKLLYEKLKKCEREGQNLTAAYIDPDIMLSKTEYIEHKERLDDEIKAINSETDIREKEIANIPTPADLKTMEVFADKVREKLLLNRKPDPESVRKLLEMLHIKVFVGVNGDARVDGWFQEDRRRLLATTSVNYALLHRRSPALA